MMSEAGAGPSSAETPAGELVVEVLTWVNRLVGGPGSGSVVFSEPWHDGDTVEGVLRRFSAQHPALHDALWTRDGAITDNLHIMINDRMIGATHTLRSHLVPGDKLSLLGQFSGG